MRSIVFGGRGGLLRSRGDKELVTLYPESAVEHGAAEESATCHRAAGWRPDRVPLLMPRGNFDGDSTVPSAGGGGGIPQGATLKTPMASTLPEHSCMGRWCP